MGLIRQRSAVALLAITAALWPCSGQAQSERERQIALQNAWRECLLEFAQRAARRSLESVDTITRAAMQHCQSEEDALFTFFTAGHDQVWRDFVVTQFFPALQNNAKDRIAATVLDARTR
jgi:hypothetical protein